MRHKTVSLLFFVGRIFYPIPYCPLLSIIITVFVHFLFLENNFLFFERKSNFLFHEIFDRIHNKKTKIVEKRKQEQSKKKQKVLKEKDLECSYFFQNLFRRRFDGFDGSFWEKREWENVLFFSAGFYFFLNSSYFFCFLLQIRAFGISRVMNNTNCLRINNL